MDFLRGVKAKLDAKTEFRTTDSIAELRVFRRDDLCILTVVPQAQGSGNTAM
jgi:hypothetical protein